MARKKPLPPISPRFEITYKYPFAREGFTYRVYTDDKEVAKVTAALIDSDVKKKRATHVEITDRFDGLPVFWY